MEITKGKYTVTLSKEDEKAIARIVGLVDDLRKEEICEDVGCTNCPFFDNFCIGSSDNKIETFRKRLEDFVNRD